MFNLGSSTKNASTGFSLGGTTQPSFGLGGLGGQTNTSFNLGSSLSTTTSNQPTLGLGTANTSNLGSTNLSVPTLGQQQQQQTTGTTSGPVSNTNTTPAATTTTASSSSTSATITFKLLEDYINKWMSELDTQERDFLNQATQLNALDKLMIENGDKVRIFSFFFC